MRKMLIYLKDYRKECILGPLFKLLEASFELFVPLIVASIIDRGIPTRDSVYIRRMCLLMAGLGLTGMLAAITAQYFSAKAAVGYTTALRHALFSHIQTLSFSETDQTGSASLITRMTSDTNQVQTGINLTLRLFLRSPFIVFGAMIMAFSVNAQAAWIFVITIPLLSIVIFGILLWSMPLYKKVQSRLDRVLRITRDNLTGVRVIRAFNREDLERHEFENENQALNRLQQRVGRISALMNPLTCVIVNSAVIALIWSGAIRVNSGVLTQGEVIALVNYMSQILVELIKLANLIITISKALASARRIQDVFEIPGGLPVYPAESLPREAQPDPDLALIFDHVSLRYQDGGAETLCDISFRVRRGQTIGIIGGTGSGKSSLVNLIPRFYDVSGGCVCVDGLDVRSWDVERLRKRIGIVLQKALLFKGTIRENLLWGNPDATEDELFEVLRVSQSLEFVEKKAKGLDEWIEQGGQNLSGGQKQRLSIARALIRKPEILILDDSASALDYATDARLRRAIRGLDPTMTVLIVSQRVSSIQYADQIIVLENGQLCGKGRHEELLQSCPVYQEIYRTGVKSQGTEGGRL